MNDNPLQQKHTAVTPYLTALGAWALAFGCSVGQGAFVMPGNTFLPVAGPVGSAVGIGLGALAMLVLARNYHFLMNRYPDSGGSYTFIKSAFGFDHGFLSAWFLMLTYIAILWANSSALPVVTRTLLGGVFQFGYLYEIAGYKIFLGEILLSLLALVAAAFLCLRRSLAANAQIFMGVGLLACVALCFGVALGRYDGAAPLFEPAFSDAYTPAHGTFTIFALAPWAYAGFESVSHSAAEARFPMKKTFRILVAAVLCAAFAYIALVLLAVTATPDGVSGWREYVARLGEYQGAASQPTFFAARSALGTRGLAALGFAALCGIFTGLVGNYIALSRLICNLAEDDMMPRWLGELDEHFAPRRALLCILGVSVILPFFGRTWISWIVDVTTVGATIAYALVSASAMKLARAENDRAECAVGAAGLVISLFFALAFLIPNLLSVRTLATESYLILAAWGVLGCLMFLWLLRRDKAHRLGRSSVALIVMLGVIIFTSTVWLLQETDAAMERSVTPIQEYYEDALRASGTEVDEEAHQLRSALNEIDRSLTVASIVQETLIALTMVILFLIYAEIMRREKQSEVEKALAEETSRAKTSFLSNMSHEIRTPMNAIIGLDNIALRNPDLPPQTREQLEKIGASARHLLGLINDILDMSRIESGRMVLKNEEFSIQELLEQVDIIIGGQCADKGLRYRSVIEGRVADYYYGDDMKLKQVLINILGNSVKFTDAPGEVDFTVRQTETEEGESTLSFEMKDSGVGMDSAFIPKLFEAFSQENASTTNRYGGSGLGMAITKNFVEMMGGAIHVESKKGVGSVFTVTVPLKASERLGRQDDAAAAAVRSSLAGCRVLMAEDVDQNAEILQDLLEMEDIEAERAENGEIALRMFAEHPAGYYDAILMDVRMPVMDGLEATRAIRALERPDAARIPIIAMTANVFEDDVRQSIEAGMNAHLSKPIELERLYDTLSRLTAGNAAGETTAG